MTRPLATFLLIIACLSAGVVQAADPIPNVHGTATAPVAKISNGYKNLDGKVYALSGTPAKPLVVEGFNWSTTRSGVLVERGQHDLIVRNGTITHSDTLSTGDNLPVGFAVNNGHDILFENVTARNFRMLLLAGAYLNGDCFSTEGNAGNVYNVTWRGTLADQCSDGGYDTKASNARFENTTAQGVDICYRIWRQATASTISCADWGKWSAGAAVQVIAASGGSFVVDTLNLTAPVGKTAKVFDIRGAGASLTVGKCVGLYLPNDGKNKLLAYADGATIGNTHITLGPGCALGLTPPVVVSLPALSPAKPPVTSKTRLPDNDHDGTIEITTSATAKLLGVPVGTKLDAKSEKVVPGGYSYAVKP